MATARIGFDPHPTSLKFRMTHPQQTHPNADVRMRGFASRSTVEAAIGWLDSVLPSLNRLSCEVVNVWNASGRVLAQDVVSDVAVPGFARSMMDGYAVRSEETHGATSYNAISFVIKGTCLPGVVFPDEVRPGEAVRIMTGAPLPRGTDGVVPVEETEADGSNVLVRSPVSCGKHVGQIGEDIRLGEVVLSAGRRLRPQDIGVLSSIGCGRLAVVQRPRVKIVITGNELLPAGTRPQGHRIADANGPMLAGLVRRDGGEPILADILLDNPDAIREALHAAAEIVLVSGGSSVGQEDHVPRLLASEGELAVHGIAMRPSSPTGMGRIGERIVFLLPGNPVSCLCAYDFFAGRAIRALGGLPRAWPYRPKQVRLTRKLVSTVGRVDYARVSVRGDEAEPLAIGGASVLSSTTRANAFVIVPADSEGHPPGAIVEAWLYEPE
jgi:molybdopterin molybdotransferase